MHKFCFLGVSGGLGLLTLIGHFFKPTRIGWLFIMEKGSGECYKSVDMENICDGNTLCVRAVLCVTVKGCHRQKTLVGVIHLHMSRHSLRFFL